MAHREQHGNRESKKAEEGQGQHESTAQQEGRQRGG
jgi:hypothetical protein